MEEMNRQRLNFSPEKLKDRDSVFSDRRPLMLVQDQMIREKSQHQIRDNVARQHEFLGQKQQLRVEKWLFARSGEQNSLWPS